MTEPATTRPAPDLAQNVLDALETGAIVLDGQRRVIAWNAWMARTSGIAAAAALGRDLVALFPDVAGTRLQATIDDALATGTSGVLTHALNPSLLPLRHRDGRALHHSVTIRPMPGVSLACLLQVSDVTAAIERERVLRQRRDARFRAVVDTALDAIVTTDLEGRIEWVNPSAERQFGHSAQDLLGREISTLLAGDGGACWIAAAPRPGGDRAAPEPFEAAIRRADGSLIVLEVSVARWASGGHGLATGILRDITARKQAEEALRGLNELLEERVAAEIERRLHAEADLRQAQKMEAIGQLTGGVAHDMNNMLLVIQSSLERIERRVSSNPDEALSQAVQLAMRGLTRAAELTRRLLAFARRQPLDPRPLEPNRLVAGMSDLLRRTLGETVAIETVLAGGLWRTFADPGQIENAIVNLAVNARDAMPEGGRLTIETANAHLDEDYAAAHHEVEPGQYVMIAVSDTGVGMSRETIEQAFEPFFTTKEPGRGTGLGLSQVYGFVKQSGGHIKIYSETGAGTTVRIYLPRYAGQEVGAAETTAPAVAPFALRAETVLVVEDDDEVRANTVTSLRELGYRVVEAPDGAEALRVLETDASVRLLFTDVGLPGGMDGRQLADEACRRHPELKVLFTTGYVSNAIIHHGRLDPGVQLIVKPYTHGALAKKLRTILARQD